MKLLKRCTYCKKIVWIWQDGAYYSEGLQHSKCMKKSARQRGKTFKRGKLSEILFKHHGRCSINEP